MISASATRTDATPLLDRMSPLPDPAPPPPDSQFVGLIAGFVVLVTSMVIWSDPQLPKVFNAWIYVTFVQTLPDHSIGIRILVAVLVSILACFAAILVHESGHVIVGWCAGFRFSSMRVSRIQFDRLFRLSISRGRGTGASGSARMIPVKSDRLVLRGLAMVLAGPIANLATGYAVLLLPVTKGFFSGGFIFWSISGGATNLLPFRHRSRLSDGKQLMTLVRNPVLGERSLALARLNAEMRDGVPPDALSAVFLTKALAVRDDSVDTVAAHSVGYVVAWWRYDYAAAAQMLETCLAYSSHVPPAVRHILMSDAGVFQARRRKRIDLAKEWLAMIPQKTEFPGLRPRVEAAILEAQGNFDGALKKLEEVEMLFLGIPEEALREANVRFLRRWKAELLIADGAKPSAKPRAALIGLTTV
jgi:hypothetical protein